MFFLLRMTFWIALVTALLPSGGKHGAVTPNARAGDALSAASPIVSDTRPFCSREPTACAIGSQAAIELKQRAQAGAKMVYDLINERAASRRTGAIDSKPSKAASPSNAKSSQDTLTAIDAAPAWRGPHREMHAKNGA